MKFSCERCKTRYSISDERVRGKVLKIRCKNCEFVITVREGMEPEAPSAEPSRPARPTTLAPAFGAPPSPPPTQAAPPPPDQIEEEWYVSIEGVQHGPFTLVQAQDWIAGQSADAELFCWCEGFGTDWQSVERVAKFRGLRGAALPRVPTLPPAAPAATSEDPFAKLTRPAGAPVSDGFGEDDLAIGEVSRVVNLADLAKGAANRSKAATPVPARTRTPGNGMPALAAAPSANREPADPMTAALASAARAAQADAVADELPAGVAVASLAPAPTKRSHATAYLIAGLLVTVVAALLIVLLSSGRSGNEVVALGQGADYNDIGVRPDDPLRRNLPTQPKGSADTPVRIRPSTGGTTTGPGVVTNNTGSGKTEAGGTSGAASELKPEEVEQMYQKQGDATRRCYEQALKKDPFLDVKKIAVTMVIDKSGTISDVNLSSHADHQLGKCMLQRIRGWRFRESTAGLTTRINVVFGS